MAGDFLPFAAPLIEEAEIQEVISALRSGWLTTGPKVHEFQSNFARYKNVPGAVALSSCTAALYLSLLTSKIKKGDEVITTPLTFCATINAIIHAGATPVLADIDPQTMNIDPREVERRITSKTKAILSVHFAGRPCDLDQLTRICRKYGLIMIEDCAHAIETEYHGIKAGTSGDFGCFSFYATKNITTGEGGMVISKNEKSLERIRQLSLHGLGKDYWKRFKASGFKQHHVSEPGFKYNMTDIQASIGIHQLNKIEKYWRKRRHIWTRYNRELVDLPIQIPSLPEKNTRHAYHLYTILLDEEMNMKRDEFLSRMLQKKIGLSIHYVSIPEHIYYQEKFQWQPQDYPNAYKVSQKTVSLPLYPKLSNDDVSFIIKAVKKVLL